MQIDERREKDDFVMRIFMRGKLVAKVDWKCDVENARRVTGIRTKDRREEDV